MPRWLTTFDFVARLKKELKGIYICALKGHCSFVIGYAVADVHYPKNIATRLGYSSCGDTTWRTVIGHLWQLYAAIDCQDNMK